MNITALNKTPPKAVAYSVVSSNGNMLAEDGASDHTLNLKSIPVFVRFPELYVCNLVRRRRKTRIIGIGI